MATAPAAAAAKSAFKLLDPTILVTSRAVRLPAVTGKIIQGKTRHPGSRAAKRWREQETLRLKKALQHLTHGKNIFVYNHLRTNQVIYSLSRTLNKQDVLSQLVYHGKKTIPPTLRKDMWIPYFSLHFPTPRQGLDAYRLLREFSLQRQLAPPEDMITITEESVARHRPRDPLMAKEYDEQMEKRIGHILPKKWRAKVLMNQKATSVADAAAMLTIHEKAAAEPEEEEAEYAKEAGAGEGEGEEATGEGKKEEGGEKRLVREEKKLSNKAKLRLKQARRRDRQHETVVRERITQLEKQLTKRWRRRVKITDENPELGHLAINEGEVKVFWNDMHDALWAESWPAGVIHGQLAPTGGHIIGNRLAEAQEAPVLNLEAEEPAKIEGAEGTKEPEKKKSGLARLKFW
ncbi:hypothetical protein AJ80_00670 [Polytolypa hystricis UAMH7299]|uniref:Large ribosomal subunit protein mL67 n=1 Tax=Polytolypa hystricis (strain UAMH7299) TaxID=1447883 RepID=A0A2B7Z148_POLH7|nr:hypothetical protein AJ80_00670 [Polytolypa hystricis UAMH7299]